jgi:hypothetical protein
MLQNGNIRTKRKNVIRMQRRTIKSKLFANLIRICWKFSFGYNNDGSWSTSLEVIKLWLSDRRKQWHQHTKSICTEEEPRSTNTAFSNSHYPTIPLAYISSGETYRCLDPNLHQRKLTNLQQYSPYRYAESHLARQETHKIYGTQRFITVFTRVRHWTQHRVR